MTGATSSDDLILTHSDSGMNRKGPERRVRLHVLEDDLALQVWRGAHAWESARAHLGVSSGSVCCRKESAKTARRPWPHQQIMPRDLLGGIGYRQHHASAAPNTQSFASLGGLAPSSGVDTPDILPSLSVSDRAVSKLVDGQKHNRQRERMICTCSREVPSHVAGKQ